MSEILGNLPIGSDSVVNDGDGSGGNNGNVIEPSNIEPPKRGRGRPPKSDGTGSSDRSGKSADTGRSSASKPAARKAQTAVSSDALAFTISIIGNFIAAKTKMEALALDAEESKTIADATANVLKHYEIPVTEKTAAWIGLATALGTVYGGKIAVIKLQRAMTVNAGK